MDKIPKNKHIKSMILWIISNKKMSAPRKLRKILRLLILLFAKNQLRLGRRCILAVFVYRHQLFFYQKLLRRTELLMKKGYTVQLDISWSEKAPLHIDSECSEVLDQLIILLKQQK